MVEVFKAISADGSTCYFGDKTAAAAWAGARGRVEWERFPERPKFGVIVGGGDPFSAVFNVLGIGSAARSVDVLLTNIQNMQRRSRCLSAIEQEFFTVETSPDPDEDGDEPGQECLLRWGDEPTDYVERFRKELPGAVARGVPASHQLSGSNSSSTSLDTSGVAIPAELKLPEPRQLPKMDASYASNSTYFRGLGWNECLAEVKRLNAHGVSGSGEQTFSQQTPMDGK